MNLSANVTVNHWDFARFHDIKLPMYIWFRKFGILLFFSVKSSKWCIFSGFFDVGETFSLEIIPRYRSGQFRVENVSPTSKKSLVNAPFGTLPAKK